MSIGYVYILTNKSMPGLVKIGKTTRGVSERAGELFQTGVPTPFDVFTSYKSPNCDELEALAHAHFRKERVSDSREFFVLEARDASEAIYNILREQLLAWVEDFMPDQAIATYGEHVDEVHISFIASKLKVPEFDVVTAIEAMSEDDLRPFVERHLENVEARRKERIKDSQSPHLRAVNDESEYPF